MDDIRVALVGYGLAGKVFHAPLISATPGLGLATVVSRDAGKVHADLPAVRVVPTFDEVLADTTIALVVLATPDELHEPQALAALDAGKHVVVDKPFALSVDGARRMTARAAARGLVLSVFQNRRWDADFLTLRRLIDAGELGEVVQFETRFNRYRPLAQETWKDRRNAGVWQDLGPHLIDQVLQLFGMPQWIEADITTQTPGRPCFDYVQAQLGYERLRVTANLSLSVPPDGLRFAVHGTRGSYLKHGLDTQEAQSKAGLKPGDAGWGVDPVPGMLSRLEGTSFGPRFAVANERGCYTAYYAGVRDALLGKGENPVPPGQALAVMTVLEAGLASARERRTVPLTHTVLP